MTATCTICGQTIEAPEPHEDPPPRECARCRAKREAAAEEHEPTYQSDLRGLIALARESQASPPPPEECGLDAPPSVREAIRLADNLLPLPPPPERAPVRRGLSIAALPVLALAVAGVVMATQGSRRANPLPTTSSPEVTAIPAPSAAEIVAPPPPEPPPAPPEPPPAPAPSAAPRAPVPSAAHTPARSPLALAPRPHVADAAPPPTTTEAPPLMQAITEAVGAAPSSAPSSPPPAAETAGAFDRVAAQSVLARIAASVGDCTAGAPPGQGGVSISFLPSGAPSQVILDGGPLAGTDAGRCVVERFRRARVPAFGGSPVTVHRSFSVR